MVGVELGRTVHDVKDADDVCEGLCRVLCQDVVNGVLWDW